MNFLLTGSQYTGYYNNNYYYYKDAKEESYEPFTNECACTY